MQETIATALSPGTSVLVFGGEAELEEANMASRFYAIFAGQVLDHDGAGLLLNDEHWGTCFVPWARILAVQVNPDGRAA